MELIAIGTSWGGLNALEIMLSGLPKNFPLPIVVVQHRHKSSDRTLSDLLNNHSNLPVVEVEDKDAIAPGYVYLAPANYHLLVEPGIFSLSTDDPVCYARPSIDVLFESAADAYGASVIGVIRSEEHNSDPKGPQYPTRPNNRPSVAGWSSPVARQAHNLKAAGSNPAPATNVTELQKGPANAGPLAFEAAGSE